VIVAKLGTMLPDGMKNASTASVTNEMPLQQFASRSVVSARVFDHESGPVLRRRR
jgi:hypothetical protein